MNNKVKIKSIECLSDNWYVLNKVTYEYQKKNGDWETHQREAYDMIATGEIKDGKTIMLLQYVKIHHLL